MSNFVVKSEEGMARNEKQKQKNKALRITFGY